MYSLVVVLACFAVVSAVDKNECGKLAEPHAFQCCKREISRSQNGSQIDIGLIKECVEKSQKKMCDADICIAKAKGYGSDDGKISDMKVLEARLEKDFESIPETLERIKTNCINNDLSKYGPPDFCDLIKLRHCVQHQWLLGCTDFTDTDRCKGFKELVEKCKDE